MKHRGDARLRRLGVLALPVITVLLALSAAATRAASPIPISWTVAGTGVPGDTGDGGQAREADINQPRSLAISPDGGFVWGEPWSNRVRKVWPDGHVSTIAGTGAAGFSGDGGPATQAQLNFVHAAAPTAAGGYVLADTMNCRIRAISSSGIITTVAGNGTCGFSGDGGPATQAEINNPRSVVGLADGGFLIPDTNNHRVRRVWPDGKITTVAGTGVQGFSGDGGPGTSAQLSIPFGVSPTADGGFLIVDAGNQRIRKVASDGTITTVAGTGTAGFSGDGGPAIAAQLNNPHYALALSDGSFLIADASNERVRMVSATGTISTFEGNGTRGFSGDGGPASAAQLSVPKGLAVTSAGDVLIADEQNNRIRFAGSVAAPLNLSPPALTGSPAQGSTLRAAPGTWSGTGPTFAYQWQRCLAGGGSCVDIAGAAGRAYEPVAADQGSTLRVRVTASNASGSASAVSAITSVVGAPLVAPTNVTQPSVTGSPVVGATLTASNGVWSGTAPFTFTRRWQRCAAACVDIPSAIGPSYVVTGDDVGSAIRAVVTASNAAGPATFPATIAGDAPTAYWRLDDGTSVASDQAGFADGAYVGSPPMTAGGLLAAGGDGAISLDGTSQYIQMSPNSAWTRAPFSLEVFVRPSAVPDNRTIAAAQTDGLNGWWLNTNAVGALRFFIGDGTAWRFAPAGPTLAPGATYDIVATYDGSAARLYVDGSLASVGPTVSMSADIGSNPLRFGSASSFAGQFWPGVIDEASFFPIALTPAQVSSHHTSAMQVPVAASAVTSLVTSGSGAGGGGGGGTPPLPPPPPSPPPVSAPAVVPPTSLSRPVLSGIPRVGRLLTATTGTWSGTDPLTYGYRWERCRRTCQRTGLNRRAYRLSVADVGARIRIVVAARNSAGTSSSVSASTKTVTRLRPLKRT